MGFVGKTVTQNIVSGSEITDGTVTGDDLASDIAISTSGNISTTGDLTVDTNTLKVDSANNKVLIGTTSEANTTGIGVVKAGGGNFIARFQNTTTGTPYGVSIASPSGEATGYPLLNVGQGYAPYTEYLRVDSGTGNVKVGGGYLTIPKQPCFLVRNSSDQSNVALNTLVTVVFDTEVFDQNADFASNTFTAPVTGRYLFTYSVNFAQVDADHTIMALTLSTSNNTFTNNPIADPSALTGDPSELSLHGAIICDMDASDTALVKVAFEGGSAQTDIKANGVRTNFGGVLLC